MKNKQSKEERQAYNLRTGYAAYKKYEKTPNGFLMRMYRNMKSRISGIQHKKAHLYAGKELMTKEQFYSIVKSSNEFDILFLPIHNQS